MNAALGIDPGKDGAGVLVDERGHVLDSWLTSELLVGREYAPSLMWTRLRSVVVAHRPTLIVLEQASGRPGEGRGSSRVIGEGHGLWRGMIAALEVPVVEPAPATWTRLVLRDAPGEGKARAVHVAMSRVPGLDLIPGKKRVPHDGLADACCLALYGLDTRTGRRAA